MAWQTDLTIIVRNLIGDLGVTQAYDDSRIEQCLAVAGLITSQEFEFDTDYTFDLSAPDITPDPTLSSTYDRSAMALFTLKAACMLNLNSYQGAVSTGIKVRDGDSEVDTTSGFKGYKDILDYGPCGAYQKLLNKLRFDNSMNLGRAVTSPASTDFSGFYGRGVQQFFDGFCGLGGL